MMGWEENNLFVYLIVSPSDEVRFANLAAIIEDNILHVVINIIIFP